MNNVWFTADEHYNHAAVIKHMKRPFSDVAEMNDALIERNNSLVKPGDRVYHLGDFAWNNPHLFLDRMNGQHYLIRGNHDYRDVKEIGFIWVKDVSTLTVGDYYFWLSHYAHAVWPRSHFGSFHLHGHSHGQLQFPGRTLDVGVDSHGFLPYHLDEVISELKSRPWTDHHISNSGIANKEVYE